MEITAANRVAALAQERTGHADAQRMARAAGKPKLSAETAVEFLDWLTTHVVGGHMTHEEATLLMRAAELVISTRHADAQDKATQHTLVERGLIAPPPTASPSA